MSIGYLIKLVSPWIYLGGLALGILPLGTEPLEQYPPGQWETIIEDQEFTEPLQLDRGDDNTLILNATFHDIHGSAITLRNVSNVYIKNCTIYNVGENGIVLRSTGSTKNVTVEGCTIYNTGRTGILAKQNEEEKLDHANLVIRDNTLYNNGTSELDHGLYIFSTDSLIENNVVYGSSGNGVSIRSSGIVRGNKIWDTRKSCIRYFSDHAPGVSNVLYIENNVCYQRAARGGNPAISLLREDQTPESWLLQAYYIRFNTVVLHTPEHYGFAVESPEFEAKHIEVYGNLFINTEDISKTAHLRYVDYISSNYNTTSLEGVVNSAQSPYNLQLSARSPARYYASKEPQFPATDINGTARVSNYLDAGAYQFSRPSETSLTKSQDKAAIEPSTQALEISDKTPAIQRKGLNNLPYFISLLGLFLVTAIIIALRSKKNS